ncbi:alkaline shock response membrane anchor protein AmaP [Corynebacterium sp. B5-R-101]|uniref:Alkaline shock response membrane anchor protein AmaP n=2 Tax=Corynebacterium TaxID=1716 RepID=A0ABT0TC28_9CORY|nr:alkaline shock response membrane anchor protein AmaP [Corynebacterium intestinale]MCL8494525.1 alkaline shock response membrane anchor protein AmaP [Corynebacterium intestinale]MCP1390761.1 alkaline shock response membrane anchor protein AmaP [Corynebacterium intestinale]
MSKTLAGIDRTILAVLGLLLIALGAWPILIHFEVPFATYLASWVDHDTWAGLPEQTWWPYALCLATIICSLAGLWLVISNLRHHRFNSVPSDASDEEGAIKTEMSAIAGAVADTLAAVEGVEKVSRLVAYDRSRPTLQYEVLADPDTPLLRIKDAIEVNDSDFRAAFPGMDVDTRYKVHFTKVQSASA